MTPMNQSILKYLELIARRDTYMERQMIEGKVDGNRTSGRSPKR